MHSKFGIRFRITFLLSTFILTSLVLTTASQAQQAHWIWSPKAETESENSVCYFRKKFTLVRPEAAGMYLAAGDKYEIYINGRIAAEGESFGSITKLDIGSYLQSGRQSDCGHKSNTSKVRRVGLAVRFRVKERGESRWRSLVSDASWKTRTREIQTWKSTSLNDLGWLPASTIKTIDFSSAALTSSQIGQPLKQAAAEPSTNSVTRAQKTSSKPARKQISLASQEKFPAPETNNNSTEQNGAGDKKQSQVAKDTTSSAKAKKLRAIKAATSKEVSDRFKISKEFTIQQVMLNKETGSLIAMAFNEFGKMLLSREGGPLMIADISKPVSDPGAFAGGL